MPLNERFAGKSVLVTGSSQGIGRALSERLSNEGATVFAAARNLSKLEELASDNGGSGKIIPIQTDIRDALQIEELFARIDGETDALNIVVNNASHGHNERIDRMEVSDVASVVSTNLMGAMLVTRQALKRMVPRNGGHVAFVSSLAGRMAFPNLSVYSATKHGIEGFADALREELSETKIVTTVIRPGVTDTDFFRVAQMQEFAATMAGKMNSPEQVASEIADALATKTEDVTIGPDKYFMPLLKILPTRIARKLLPFFS